MLVRSFRDLIVWQKAFALCLRLYRLTDRFPDHERFGLTAELRKTARSVPYNISEGNKRRTRTDYLRMLGIASGSLGELTTQILLAKALGYIGQADEASVERDAEEVDRMLNALIRALKAAKKRRNGEASESGGTK